MSDEQDRGRARQPGQRPARRRPRVRAPAAAARRPRTLAAARSRAIRRGAGGGTRSSGRSVSAPRCAMIGSRPEEDDAPVRARRDGRRQHRPDDARARPRPSRAARTSAAAGARACVRPIATYAMGGIAPAPKPWMNRPTTSTGIVGASPRSARPTANRPSPTTNGTTGRHGRSARRRRRCRAATPSRNAENTQPYSSMPPRSPRRSA